jgi:predicted RNA binding protein YcfA (HicA-like mRNA interferase family)
MNATITSQRMGGRSGSHRVLVKGDQQRIWAYHDGVDLGSPAMARIARDYGYTVDELRKL